MDQVMDGQIESVGFGCQQDLMVMADHIGMLNLLMEVMKMLCQVDEYGGKMNEINKMLICRGIKYYSRKDENVFFEWIKKIDCIDSVVGIGRELHLNIACKDLHDDDLRDLLALFYRYSLDMKQLRCFLNEGN